MKLNNLKAIIDCAKEYKSSRERAEALFSEWNKFAVQQPLFEALQRSGYEYNVHACGGSHFAEDEKGKIIAVHIGDGDISICFSDSANDMFNCNNVLKISV